MIVGALRTSCSCYASYVWQLLLENFMMMMMMMMMMFRWTHRVVRMPNDRIPKQIVYGQLQAAARWDCETLRRRPDGPK